MLIRGRSVVYRCLQLRWTALLCGAAHIDSWHEGIPVSVVYYTEYCVQPQAHHIEGQQ